MGDEFEKYSKKTKYDVPKQTKAENFKYLNERYPAQNCTVIIGDSIVELWNLELFKKYAKVLDCEVLNRGISGDTSDRMYQRLEENAINIKPKNIAVLIGTNDIGLGLPPEFSEKNVENSIKLIREKLPETKIIIISLLPVNKNIGLFNSCVGKRNNELIDELNLRYMELCKKYKVDYLDINTKLKDKKGRFEKDYTYDGLHPNIKGFVLMTPELIDLLK